jgi:tousled-like kinase
VACKIHQLNAHWSHAKKENYIRHATREYEIQKDLHYEHIVELYGLFGLLRVGLALMV